VFCLNVSLNGRLLCSAGVANATMVNAHLGGSVFRDEPASFHVAGMQELPGDRSAHVYWLEEAPLSIGDTMTFSPLRDAPVSEPLTVEPTDSPEYWEKQREYGEFLSAHIWPQPMPVRRRPNVTLGLAMPGFPEVAARLPLGHEHILCSVSWNMWRPERVRVFIRSFVGHSQDLDMRKLEWLSAELPFGETLRVDLRA
jgi:hypothetical protein